MNRTFTLCFLLYPIALPFGYVLVYTFYHYAVPDANSNLTVLNTNLKGKFPNDFSYIVAVIPRIGDMINSEGPASLLNDITFMVQEKGILSGEFGYNAVYSDKPAGETDWGYVKYFKHADSYVTVKIYPESSQTFYIGRFVLGEIIWSIPWKKVQCVN